MMQRINMKLGEKKKAVIWLCARAEKYLKEDKKNQHNGKIENQDNI